MDKYKKMMHQWIWLALIVFLGAGLIYPVLGIAALICMLAPVITAFFQGRTWCGYFCPRGSFNDIILAKFSRRLKLPAILRTMGFRLFFWAFLMTAFGIQIVIAWGNPAEIGQVFVRMVFITTLLAIILGFLYQPRAWCLICPMGTMAHYVSKSGLTNSGDKRVVFQKDRCTDCRICSRHCPIYIDVHGYKKAGKVNHADCLKCNTCVAKCPKKSLCVA